MSENKEKKNNADERIQLNFDFGTKTPYVAVIIFVVMAGVLGFASVVGLDVPVAVVCIVVVIEVALAACLDDIPIGIHGIVMLIQLILGIACMRIVYMLLNVLIYAAALITIEMLQSYYTKQKEQ